MGKKKGRRPKGSGTLRRQRNGRWKATRTINWRTRDTESETFDSHADAEAWLAQKRAVIDAATKPDVSPMLFSDWVATWLADVEREHATATHQSYDYHANTYLIPNLARLPVRDISPLLLRNFFADLEKNACKSATRQKVYATLQACLQSATDLEVISRNPIAKVSKPSHERKRIDPFTLDEIRAILDATKEDRLHGMYVTLFHLGLRQGECYALEWSDLDVEAKTLSISRQVVSNRGVNEVKKPKTAAGIRVIDLADETLNAILDRRRLALTEKLAGCPLIFPGRRGCYLNRSSVAHRWWKEKILKKLGIKPRGLHNARHSFASHALSNGEDLVTVSSVLGHANPSVTLRIYSHLVEKAQRRTTERMAKLFSTTSDIHPARKSQSS
jgi:integrase